MGRKTIRRTCGFLRTGVAQAWIQITPGNLAPPTQALAPPPSISPTHWRLSCVSFLSAPSAVEIFPRGRLDFIHFQHLHLSCKRQHLHQRSTLFRRKQVSNVCVREKCQKNLLLVCCAFSRTTNLRIMNLCSGQKCYQCCYCS